MPFNISAFKANGLVYGGARPTQFMVYLTVPAGIGIDSVSVDKFRFVCESADLPESTIGHIPVHYFGRPIKVSGDRTYPAWPVTVLNDEDFAVRGLFEAWHNAINRIVSNVRDPVLGEERYKVDLEVVQFSKDGSVIRSYQLIGAWPTNIGTIALNWESANAIEKFSVSFEYDYWLPLVETSDKKAGGVNIYKPNTAIDGPLGAL